MAPEVPASGGGHPNRPLRLPVPFAVGNVLRTPGRTLTDGDFAAIVNASWENGPLHVDDTYMVGTGFGRRILGGPCLVAIAAGLSSSTMYASWGAAGLDCRAALGIDEVRYDAPVFAGDTVRVDSEVLALRSTPGGTGWFGEVGDRMVNQQGRVVLRMRRSYLLTDLAPTT
jgi:acyl dehydratase